MPESTVSNPAQVAGDEIFNGPFHAYALMYSSNSNDWPTIAVLYFSDVSACKQWWDLFTKVVKAGKLNQNEWTEKTVKKHSMQWYTWPSTSSPWYSMRDIEKLPDMAAVKGKWSFKCVKGDNTDGGFPTLAFQNDNGWPTRQEYQYSVPAHLPSQPAQPDNQTAILKALERINDSLASIQADLASSRAANSSSSGNGANWDDGKNWNGGYESYQIVENAYRKAKELKDRGDDRSFSMIFAQLSMEMRRKVGT